MRLTLLTLLTLATPLAAQSRAEQLPAAWAAAANAGDSVALAALYDLDDAAVTTIGGGRVARGRDAVRAELGGVVRRGSGQRFAIDSVRVDADGSTRALLTAHWRVRTPPPDPRTARGVVSMLLVRRDAQGAWRIRHDHWSVTPEAPAALPVTAALPDSGPAAPDAARLLPCERPIKVVDGDTIDCANAGRVRLIGIDTPERGQPPFGAQATAALRALVDGARAIMLEGDVEPRDRYRRVLAYVWVDGRMANWLLARSGWAQSLTYPPNVRYSERFAEAVRAARAEGRGLWATGGFECSPKEHRDGKC